MSDSGGGNITWHSGEIDRADRAAVLGQKGATIWLTGLSGSGKSTIAAALEHALLKRGHAAYRLDGDNIRHGLNRDLAFSTEDRAENIRRIGEVSRLFADAGVISIVCFISPYRTDRDAVRALHAENDLPFVEVFVNCPLDEAEKRDPKGLYAKARAGEITGFTGIDDPYEEPVNPQLVLNTHELDVNQSVQHMLDMLQQMNLLSA